MVLGWGRGKRRRTARIEEDDMNGLYTAIVGMAFVLISALSISTPAHRIFSEGATGERYRDEGVVMRVFFALCIGYFIAVMAAQR